MCGGNESPSETPMVHGNIPKAFFTGVCRRKQGRTSSDQGVTIPDARVAIPDAPVAIPDARVAIPDACVAIPGAPVANPGARVVIVDEEAEGQDDDRFLHPTCSRTPGIIDRGVIFDLETGEPIQTEFVSWLTTEWP